MSNSAVGFVEMTRSCARDLTDRIKTAGEEFATLLYRAHEERAWQALGYDSWKAYCRAEFQLSRPRSYQLLDFVEIKRKLEVSTKVDTPQTERQTRALKSVPAEKRAEVWETATEKSGGEQPTAKQIAAVVAEVLEPDPVAAKINQLHAEICAAGLVLEAIPDAENDNAPSKGIKLAEQAIRILSKIAPNDKHRRQAFREVQAWINLQK